MESHRDDGFTLVELLVIVVIIGTLIAVAIPTFFGASRRAGERRAQETAAIARRAQQVHKTAGTGQTYTTSPVELKQVESVLTYEPAPAAPPPTPTTLTGSSDRVFVQTSPDSEVSCVSAVAPNGTVFSIMDTALGETFYREGATLPLCDGDSAQWSAKW